MNTSCLSVPLFSRRHQIWQSAWANTWAIARNWPRGSTNPLPYNIANSHVPNGWQVTADFDAQFPEVLIHYPAAADRSGHYTIFVTGASEGQVGSGDFLLPPLPFSLTTVQIEGEETIRGLPLKGATEITVSHPEQRFPLSEYPTCEAPRGVRVSVLACGLNGDQTNEEQFVLLIENQYSLHPVQGVPDLMVRWKRRGLIV